MAIALGFLWLKQEPLVLRTENQLAKPKKQKNSEGIDSYKYTAKNSIKYRHLLNLERIKVLSNK
jgi:hypothetical protein